MGWIPASESTTTIAPRSWSTNQVPAGGSYSFGQTKYGLLRIRADQFTSAGNAVVTLELDAHGIPSQSSVSIPNKGYKVQSFQQATEFYIFLREANFQTENPWAAFTVCGSWPEASRALTRRNIRRLQSIKPVARRVDLLASRVDLLRRGRVARSNRALRPRRLEREGANLDVDARRTPGKADVRHPAGRGRIAGNLALTAAGTGAHSASRSTSTATAWAGGGWPAACRCAARIRPRRIEARIVQTPISAGSATLRPRRCTTSPRPIR